jgi:RNA polymerase II subunit A-like phosphatase
MSTFITDLLPLTQISLPGLLSLGLQRVRKLALILDLDNTLIHACPAPYMEEGQPSGMEENMHYIRFTEQMISQGPMVTKFANKQAHYIKLRDGLADFLAATSRLYQLSVYTHGTRAYAEAVVAKLDPDKTLMGKRIVSRYESSLFRYHILYSLTTLLLLLWLTRTDTNNKNIKSLENLFLDDWSMVVVMDDREDVWLDGGKQQHMHLLKVRNNLSMM